MALIECRECGRKISDMATACPGCGAPPRATLSAPAPVSAQPRSKEVSIPMAVAILGGVCVVGFLAVGIVASNNPDIKARSQQKDAITYCDSEYKRLRSDQRMTYGALSIAAAACEKLRNDYRRDWGRDP